MASYQMPQFLDSGDKILGPLNLRQFGYALGGFMLSMIIYSVTSTLFPRLGVLAAAPAIPVAVLALYLALGKFNGRDTDIYAFKYLLYLIKPKYMTYQRSAYVDDLNQKLAELTVEKINKRWLDNVVSKQNTAQNDYTAFATGDSLAKAKTISRIGGSLDQNYVNSMTDVERRQLLINELKEKETLFNASRKSKGSNVTTPLPNLVANDSSPVSELNNPNIHNFFASDSRDE